MSITWIGIGSICFLFFVAGLVALGVYAFSRGKRRRPVPSRRTAFDPSAFREQLVENIAREVPIQPRVSREQPAKNIDPQLPKYVIYAGLLGLILLAVIIAVVAIAAATSITDPSVAQTAIFNISMGLVLLVAIVGAVVVIVARMILKRPASSSEQSPANEFAENRLHTPLPAPAYSAGPRQCPVCQATIPDDSPEGLCPKCVLGRCMQAPESPVLLPNPRETAPFDGPSAAPLPGDLASKFAGLEILELLGQGGMGAVYKARQTKLDRIVAVKILPPEWGTDPAFAERFAREAKALARLSHPHIVAVHDFGESDGQFYLVMEYVDGANLRNILANGGLEPHEALAIVPQICDALQYAHEEGIVHRDIKPENILLDSKGRVKIADFGLAKLTNRPRATFTLTGSQQIMGTLDYMAPEQRLSPQQVDHRADIYSLGVVFYEMLTGELPLGRFAPPSQKSGVDARLDGIVFRALEREPAQRYQRISEVKSDVQALAPSNGPATPSRPKTHPFDPQAQSQTTRRIRSLSLGLVFLALFGWSSVPVYVNLAESIADQELPLLKSILFILASVSVPMSGLVSLGAYRAWQHDNLTFVRLMTVLAMLPWSFGFPFALPLGIWILLELSNPAVRAAFAARHPRNSARGQGGPSRGIVTEAGGSVLCIPIKLGGVWDRQYPGLLRIESDSLVLEYSTGSVRAKVKEAVLPMHLVRRIRITQGWFSTSLDLQMASLKSLEGIPTCAQGRLQLAISSKDRESAERLIWAVQKQTSALEVQRYPAQAWRDDGWPAPDSPVAPAIPVPQTTGPVRRKLMILFNSVYTMFFSRPKNPDAATSDPAHERSPSQP